MTSTKFAAFAGRFRTGLRNFRSGAALTAMIAWLEQIDPGMHRRIKGLRLVTAYGIAALLGTQPDIMRGLQDGASLSALAGGFALWASVFEARATRAKSSRDLALLCAADALGAAWMIVFTPILSGPGRPGPELSLVLAAFLVSYLKRFGVLGAGIGSQFFIGQMLALTANLSIADLPMVAVAGVLASVAAIVPRVLSGPAEQPILPPPAAAPPSRLPAEMIMGLQAALAALVIIVLDHFFNLVESGWAIAACTYVVANSTAETMRRIRHRIIGTAIGVPLGLACLPIIPYSPILIWIFAALAMVIYAMALPERYDIACGTYAFTLIVTLAVTGETSIFVLASRAWETLLGGVLGLGIALVVVPLRTPGGTPLRQR
jgi:hypothetical protein